MNVIMWNNVDSCHEIWTWSGHRQDDYEDDGGGDKVDDKDEEDSDNINYECDDVKQCG